MINDTRTGDRTEVPSVLSIWAMACVTGAMLATSVWIALGPVAEYNLRTALGALLGFYAGMMTGVHTIQRISRRLEVRDARA